MSATEGVSVDGRYSCFYCTRREAMKEAGLTKPTPGSVAVTVHDQRGCMHLCWAHAIWRKTTSRIDGHSKDCPHRGSS